MTHEKLGVLFVCMGNICRSPTAEGVFRHYVAEAGLDERILVDSAGTHAYHVNDPPDHRARAAAKRRGFSLDKIRARRISPIDYERFDYILAMDLLNLETIKAHAVEDARSELKLFLDFSGSASGSEVPDPYYGGAAGFERVLDLVEDASQGLLDALRLKI